MRVILSTANLLIFATIALLALDHPSGFELFILGVAGLVINLALLLYLPILKVCGQLQQEDQQGDLLGCWGSHSSEHVRKSKVVRRTLR